MQHDSSAYTYRYQPCPLGATDETQRAIVLRNVSESQAMDALRARLAPTASQLRAHVLASSPAVSQSHT